MPAPSCTARKPPSSGPAIAPTSDTVRRAACSRARTASGATSYVDVATDPSDSPFEKPMSTAIAMSGPRLPVNGMSRNAMPGIAVLGTVAHFRPILSTMNPAGTIITSEPNATTRNRSPIWLGVRPISFMCSGTMAWYAVR